MLECELTAHLEALRSDWRTVLPHGILVVAHRSRVHYIFSDYEYRRKIPFTFPHEFRFLWSV